MLDHRSRVVDIGAAKLTGGGQPHRGAVGAPARERFFVAGGVCFSLRMRREAAFSVGRQCGRQDVRTDGAGLPGLAGAEEAHDERVAPRERGAVLAVTGFDDRGEPTGPGGLDADGPRLVQIKASGAILLSDGPDKPIDHGHPTHSDSAADWAGPRTVHVNGWGTNVPGFMWRPGARDRLLVALIQFVLDLLAHGGILDLMRSWCAHSGGILRYGQ